MMAYWQHEACHPLQHLCADGVILLYVGRLVGTAYLINGKQAVYCALIHSRTCIIIDMFCQSAFLV